MDGGDWPRHSIDMVLGAYKNQILLAFDGLTTALLLAGMAYCFSAAALPITLAILLGTALVPLILRGGFTHPFDINGKTYPPSSRWQYAMDSMADSVVTMVMVLFCQSLTLMISPQLAMKPDPLFRGIALGMPVLAAMRMAMRPRAQRHAPFRGSNLTAEQIYKRAWWMNILWIAGFQGVILGNPDFLPKWIPLWDFFQTFIPMKAFVVWFRVQQNALIRRDHVETALGMHWKKKDQARQREVLMKGLGKREPLYSSYVGLQVFLFAYLAIPLAWSLWPWLSGDRANRDAYAVLFRVVIWVTLAWSWTYLKDANRAAADAIQQDIDSSRIPEIIKLRTRVANWIRHVRNTDG
jgi:hypothetical protein